MPTITVLSNQSSHKSIAPKYYSTSPTAYSTASGSTHSTSSSHKSSSTSHRSRHSTSPPSPVSSPGRPGTFSTYAPTTLSGFNRRRSEIAIDGLPAKDYFTSGQSQVDRQWKYISGPDPRGAVPAPQARPGLSSIASGSGSGGGKCKQVVKYRQGNRHGGDERGYESDADDDYDDRRTVRPEDSISQVDSYASSVSRGRRSGRRELGDALGSGASAGNYGGSGGSTFSKLSTFQSDQVYDGQRECWIEERRPRASALVR